jgi:cytochrome c553
MAKRFRDSAHLVRPAVVILLGLGLFLVVRSAVIPKAFGQYGHYRPGALETIRKRPISYAGQQMCVLCHEDEGKVRAEGKHARVACEACHGPLAKHADDPASLVPKLPDVATLCVRCHEDEGKVRAEGKHARVACEACHGPLAKHADDPASLVPKLPDVATLCVRCHEKNAAKPAAFPQVVSAEHSGGMVCDTCHKPHNPKL